MYPYGVHAPTLLLFLGSNFSFHFFFFSFFFHFFFQNTNWGFFGFFFLFFIFYLLFVQSIIIYFSYSRYFMYVCRVHISHKRGFSLHTHDIMEHDWFKVLYRCAVVCGVCIYVCMYSYIHNMGACMRTNDTENEPLQGSHHLFVLPYHT